MQIKTSSTLPFNRKTTFDEFQKNVEKFDFVNTLMSLQRLSAFLANQTGVNINLEYEFHTGPRVKHQILLPKDFIPFAAKQCILKCGASDIEYNDLDLTNLTYKYGNIETDLDHSDPSSPDAWLWVLRATNHQWCYLRLASSIMGRYLWLFEKVFEDSPRLKIAVDNALLIEFFDALKIGTCIFSNYCPRPEGFATSFEMSNFTNTTILNLKPLLTEENITKFFNIFSINQAGFIDASREYEVSDPLLKKYEFNPLKRFPIIRTESEVEIEKYIIPSLPDFLYACFEGMYYVLLDRLEETDKVILFQTFGKQFEMYIGELLNFYNIPTFSNANLIPEPTYRNGGNEVKGVDWLIVGEEHIYQIECKKRKLNNYAKAGIEDEDSSGIDTLLQSISEELDKLPKKERHIQDNLVGEIEYSGQKFINIIVYLDEMFALNKYARETIKSKMSESIDNCYILGCYEFEMLCQHANEKHISFKNALDDMTSNRIEVFSIDFLDRIYHDFFKGLMSP